MRKYSIVIVSIFLICYIYTSNIFSHIFTMPQFFSDHHTHTKSIHCNTPPSDCISHCIDIEKEKITSLYDTIKQRILWKADVVTHLNSFLSIGIQKEKNSDFQRYRYRFLWPPGFHERVGNSVVRVI